MKKLFVLFAFVLVGCGEQQLSEREKTQAMWHIAHYASKMPAGANFKNRFNAEFNDYYKAVAADYKWLEVKSKDDKYYFLVSRPARSITPMFEGIGGTFVLKGDSVLDYEEVFRMWKMQDTTLDVRGKQMFDRMVAGKDLSLYYPRITGDKFIEVPDGRFVFDKEKKTWIDTTGPR